MSKKHSYYYLNHKLEIQKGKSRVLIGVFICFLIIGVVGYVSALYVSPQVLANNSDSMKVKQENYTKDSQDYVLIKKINVAAPINDESSTQALDSGAWWKNSEDSHPEEGGNVELVVSKFKLGLTPNQTKELSQFYNLDKLDKDDLIEVHLNQQVYKYIVTEKKTSNIDASLETLSRESSKLIIYTSDQSGNTDNKLLLVAESKDNVNDINASSSKNAVF